MYRVAMINKNIASSRDTRTLRKIDSAIFRFSPRLRRGDTGRGGAPLGKGDGGLRKKILQGAPCIEWGVGDTPTLFFLRRKNQRRFFDNSPNPLLPCKRGLQPLLNPRQSLARTKRKSRSSHDFFYVFVRRDDALSFLMAARSIMPTALAFNGALILR